ncbi:MAG TPA: kynureninase [Thermomicrobiales bacterium]|nr:kynureninase [Thermomicrobiales bacterium]
MTEPDTDTEAYARSLDANDPLARFRKRFHLLPETIYLDGNSLGLLSHDAEAAVLAAMQSWKEQGINGWLEADPPWFTLGEALGGRMAALVGAGPESVVVTGTTTVNLHQMVGSFYRPSGVRRKILATALDFPSDIYALQSQVRQQGGDPARDLALVPSRDGRSVEEEDIIAAMTDDVALVLLPSVLYRSGQLLDIPRLTEAAHQRGALIGWDCAHSVGALPHAFDEWDVDFAVWCSYKYLNAGPGAVGALYVNPRHFGQEPALAGWWGYRKDQQFEMAHHWQGASHAGAWQISTIPLLSSASVLGSLSIFEEAGIDAVRSKSLNQTDYLIRLIRDSGLGNDPYRYRIGTPQQHSRRGGHLAIEHEAAARIAQALIARKVIVDFRKPNVIRLAPIALYTTYHELWRAVQVLREIIETGEQLENMEVRSVT